MNALLVAVVTTTLASCATERPARAAALDPSSPAAPEGAALAAVTLGRTPVPSADMAQPSHDHGGATSEGSSKSEGASKNEASYTCQMHPEVVSPKPGKCPKCGMKLVPKTPAPAPEKTK